MSIFNFQLIFRNHILSLIITGSEGITKTIQTNLYQ